MHASASTGDASVDVVRGATSGPGRDGGTRGAADAGEAVPRTVTIETQHLGIIRDFTVLAAVAPPLVVG